MALEHRISELDTYLFAKGTHYEIYEKMGAHLAEEVSAWLAILTTGTERRIRCSRFSSPEYGIFLFRG